MTNCEVDAFGDEALLLHHLKCIELGRHHSDDGAGSIDERAARVARLDERIGLQEPAVVPDARQGGYNARGDIEAVSKDAPERESRGNNLFAQFCIVRSERQIRFPDQASTDQQGKIVRAVASHNGGGLPIRGDMVTLCDNV